MSITPRKTLVLNCATSAATACALVLAALTDGSSSGGFVDDRTAERTEIREFSPAPVAAKTKRRKRHSAMDWALNQKGKWYQYGSTGPRTFDCSGLVQAAYRRAGISLPRTTHAMLASKRLKRVSRAAARWGDLAFYSSGHVELYSHGNWTFGAHKTGTRIGYRKFSSYYQPKWYFRIVGAS